MAQEEFHIRIESMAWADRFLGRLNLSVLLLAMIGILFLIAWNRGVALLYGALWVLVCIYAVAWSYPRLGLSAIGVNRRVPEKAHEGERIEIVYELHNGAFFSRYLVELLDSVTLFEKEIFVLIPKLARRKIFRYEAECMLRGVHRFGDIALQSGFPLGIALARTSVALTPQTLLVYPRPEPVGRLHGGGDRSSRLHEDFYMERSGGHEEFIGLREYREGDSPRTIHWPTSARTGSLMVREYHENVAPRLTIVLNLNRHFDAGKGKDSLLEYSVKIAASLGVAALQRGWRVDLVAMGKELWHLRELSGEKERMVFLEALAQVRCDGDASYNDVLEYCVASGIRGGTIVLFDRLDAPFSGMALDRRDFFMQRYSFDAGSFQEHASKTPSRHGVADGGERHYIVKKGASWQELLA